MSTPARRRLMRDFKKLQDDPPSGVCAAPNEDNIMLWNAVIFGPQETPFEDGTFKLKMKFSEDYPNLPPDVHFVSPMFHPNVYSDGQICLDIFQNRWSPTYDVEAILTSIQSLLNDPNPNSPANNEAASLFRENKREYEKRIHDIVQQSWENDDEDDLKKYWTFIKHFVLPSTIDDSLKEKLADEENAYEQQLASTGEDPSARLGSDIVRLTDTPPGNNTFSSLSTDGNDAQSDQSAMGFGANAEPSSDDNSYSATPQE